MLMIFMVIYIIHLVRLPFIKVCLNNSMSRPVCEACKRRYAAVNYHRNDKTYYRKRCDYCTRKNRHAKPLTPKWQQNGYKQKKVCDRCGYRAKYAGQTLVYHMDGNLNNCNLNNLSTICLNCSMEVMALDLPWKVGDLTED